MGQLARQRIWQDRSARGNERLVLIALADATPDDRYTCYPSVQTIADMSNVSARQVQRIIQALAEAGRIDVVMGRGRNHTTRYAVLVGLSNQEAMQAMIELKGDIAMSPIDTVKGDTKGDVKHDIAMSPFQTTKGDISEEKVTYPALKGDIAMSPEQNEQKIEQNHVAPIASDDAPTPVSEIIEPSPIRKPRKVKAAAPVTPHAEPSEHKRLMTAYAEVLGYPFPNGGKEAAGARKLLDAGYTVEQSISAYCEMKAQAFWASKHLSLHNVMQDIGAIVNRQTAKQRAAAGRANGAYQNGAPRHHVAPSDPGILDAAEMRRQMAELLGGGK